MKFIKIQNKSEIPKEYINTPIYELLCYQNLGVAPKVYSSAELLIGMCMDNRNQLKIIC